MSFRAAERVVQVLLGRGYYRAAALKEAEFIAMYEAALAAEPDEDETGNVALN